MTELGPRGLDLHKIKKYIMSNNVVYMKYDKQHFLLRYTEPSSLNCITFSRGLDYRANLAVCATS